VTRRLAGRLLGALLVAAAVWFLTAAIVDNWEALREHEWRVNPVLLVASVAAHVGVLVWGVLVWGRVQRQFTGAPVRARGLLRIWFLSNLARYIPGKVFQFIAVAHLGRGAGAAPSVLLASLLIHTGLSLLTATLLAGLTLGTQLLPAIPPLLPAAAISIAAVIAVHPAPLNAGLRVVARLTRRDLLRWQGSWRDGLGLLLLSLLSWVLYGVAYYLFLAALTPLPPATLPVLAGVNALSFVAGYLAIVTPGGLGVREAAMTALLLPLLPQSVAAVLAIASRLWTIAAEIVGGLLALVLARRSRLGDDLPPLGSSKTIARDH
jgi:glycosyltransferase 2 family protein